MSAQAILLLLIGVLLGALLFFFFFRLFIRNRDLGQTGKPLFDEKAAEKLLQSSGYRILSKALKATVITAINGKDHFGYIQADYLVERLKKKYTVLVHSGEGNPDPNEEHLRRRLLELDQAFKVDGLLVLDLNKGEAHLVSFRFPHERNIDFYFHFLIGLFIISLVIGIIWLLAQARLI